ncbi:MAG TPA: divalent-cation tolerance protein CutA [Bryobacteraceae bacterium]|nr:divalent-cation tolerance protein CutA [Bryobacteraceae bacterium]
MTDKIVVLSTCTDAVEAEGLARGLVDKRLAACVNIVTGARSIYRWRGVVEEAPECLLIIKSRRDLLDRLRSELERLHSYEVPEVLALVVAEGSPAYLSWLEHELKPEP